MFSYYGSKSKLLKHYPRPEYDRIVEPFAGSARYALKWWKKDVTLLEINPVVYGIWHWLIRDATEKDVYDLPKLKRGDDLRNFKQLSQVERDFLGFAAGGGREAPGNVVVPRSDDGYSLGRAGGRVEMLRQNTLDNLPKVRHWKVYNISYEDYRINAPATWFIDPPYKGPAGRAYPYHAIDYDSLARWCLGRNGQTIVCEGREGDWLPFETLKTGNVSMRKDRKTIEKVFVRDNLLTLPVK